MASATVNAISWETPGLQLHITIDDDGVPQIADLTPAGSQRRESASKWFPSSSISLNSVRSVGDGNTSVKTSKALIGSYLSRRLRYRRHEEAQNDKTRRLDVVSADEASGLEVTHHFVVYDDVPVLRSYASVRNLSTEPVIIGQVSSLSIGGLTKSSNQWWGDYTVATARNTWFREAMWEERTLSDAGLDTCYLFELQEGHDASMATFGLSNKGSFSTQGHLPMGALQRKDGRDTWLWQIESSGSWRWEIGDYRDSVYLAAGGPTYNDHDWELSLAPGEEFHTVPVACCHVHGDLEAAFAALSDYRRKILRPHPDHDNLPIIFNDYMNCLMGDPTEDKIKALLDPVVQCGAEYFVIDAGWYADDSNWWDDVGLWEPSKKRFPSGFKSLLDTIRESGLIPGVWLEPEVVGIKSIVGSQLPEDAFFHQNGKRVVERDRWQLDFRHPAVRERMHGIVDKLVTHYGVGYFKFDYNIEVLSGNDVSGCSPGVAHLQHQRAYCAWVGELLDKYPSLVIENCSSGAQRMDYAMLATHTLQSTSDQQRPEAYAAIAAGVPTAVIPEQSATWAYPQGAWSDELNAFTVINSLLGRVHLSGRLDHLQPHQLKLIQEGMQVYKSIRHLLIGANPVWPLGLPKWHDDWVALGMKCSTGDVLLSVWRRGGPTKMKFPLSAIRADSEVRLLYPSSHNTVSSQTDGWLEVTVPSAICGRFFHLVAKR